VNFTRFAIMPSTEIQIRIATLNDISGILDVLKHNLIQQTSATQNVPLQTSGFLIHGFTEDDLEAAIMDATNHIVLVATENNTVVGYALSYDLRHIKPHWVVDIHGTPEIHALLATEKILYHRHIAKHTTTQGVGRQLLQALIAEAKARDYSYILCQIVEKPLQNIISIKLHEESGFLAVGFVEDDQYTLGIYLKSML
jgi:L-amino acid N-acyltransferase YncA